MSNQIPQNSRLIGLGAMDAGMANSLRRAGDNDHVYDSRPEAVSAFIADGGMAFGSALSVADACPIVISVLIMQIRPNNCSLVQAAWRLTCSPAVPFLCAQPSTPTGP